MLKKTISYTDYDGTERKEDFYFNLNKAEIIELEASIEGGLEQKVKNITDKQDSKEIIDLLKKIIWMSYGVKSDDGRRMIKSQTAKDEFMESEAYSELFMELATNGEAATAFINGILPKDVANAQNNVIPMKG